MSEPRLNLGKLYSVKQSLCHIQVKANYRTE